ncbi:hypothetical protein HDU93_002864 [Gonapodya sp. JEL0774]|nr:hypothetical protein HDU93_002864 [Gonapodya sp. JEL0774]
MWFFQKATKSADSRAHLHESSAARITIPEHAETPDDDRPLVSYLSDDTRPPEYDETPPSYSSVSGEGVRLLPHGSHIIIHPASGQPRHGIYAGSESVVRYNVYKLGTKDGPIEEVSLKDFVGLGGRLEIRENPPEARFVGAPAVERARRAANKARSKNTAEVFRGIGPQDFVDWCFGLQEKVLRVGPGGGFF